MAYADDLSYLAHVSAVTGERIRAKSPGYARRLAGQFRAQERLGLPFSRQAARGHVVTPEHGRGGAIPTLPESPRAYRGGRAPKSKYSRVTRPLVHHRPRVRKVLPFDRGVVYTVQEEADVWRILDQWNPDDRVILTGYDCTTRSWASILLNEGGKPGGWHKPSAGMRIDYLRRLVQDSGLSLEEFMVAWVDDEYRGARLRHVCVFQLHIYPRDILKVPKRRFRRRF